MAFVPWVAAGQLDYDHNWAGGEGGTGDDYGRGVALWHDGTVCQLTELDADTASQMKLTLSWPDTGGVQMFSRVDGGSGPGGEIFPRDIAAGNNFVDMGSGPYDTAWTHTVGSFIGEVMIDDKLLESGVSGTTVGALVTRDSVDLNSPGTPANAWATAFTSTDIIEALTVASSPLGIAGGDTTASGAGPISGAAGAATAGPGAPANDIYRPLTYEDPGPSMVALPSTVGVGGYFKGFATFPTEDDSSVIRNAPGGVENGYVVLVLHSDEPGLTAGRVLRRGPEGPSDSASILQIASPNGNTRVTGIAIDPKDYTVAVTGWFEAADTNFNPAGVAFPAPSHAGARDIFVAVYEPNYYGRLSLQWLSVVGTQYDDEGAGVAFDSAGAVYATGWKGTAAGDGDLWIARFNKQTGGTFPRSVNPVWQYTYTGAGDDRGLDVAVDHLDRALITGRFGLPSGPGNYCLDFDPRSGVDLHCTAGGSDIFVIRFWANSFYAGGYAIGADKDETGAAIATEPLGTGRIAIGGTFGIGSTPPYAVDFDPAGGAALHSDGGADGFISALDQQVPEDVLSQVSIVFDNSGSMSLPDTKYVALMTALRSKLLASNNVKTNGTVVLGAVAYSNGESATPFMPWTLIDSPNTLNAVANRLARQALPTGGNNRLPEGIQVVGDQFQFMTAPGAYRHLVAIAEQESLGDPSAEIDALFSQSLIDQASGIATFETSSYGSGRRYILNEVAESVAQFAAADPLEGNLGMAAQVSAMLDPAFPDLLDRFIKRVTVCPGDYDRLGCEDAGDATAFFVGSSTGDLYADWNFNGVFDGHLPPQLDRYDRPKFETGLLLQGCECP